MRVRVGALAVVVAVLAVAGCHHQEKGCLRCPCSEELPRCNEGLECFWGECLGTYQPPDGGEQCPLDRKCGLACCEGGLSCLVPNDGVYGCGHQADAAVPVDVGPDGRADAANADGPVDAASD